MQEFLYWKQVQERLSRRVLSGNEPYSFYDAIRELWEDGEVHRAEELPPVSFADWDAMDFDGFDRIYDQVPIEMDTFYRSFEQKTPAAKASESAITLNVLPLRIAWDQALGIHHHEFFEIEYVMRGEATLELEGGSRPLHSGEFCFLSPNLRHDIVPARGAQVIGITIPGVTVEQTLYRLLRKDTILSNFFHAVLDNDKIGYMLISVPEERRIREIIRGILHEYFAREKFAAEIMPDHLAILFAFILRSCGERYEWHGEDSEHRGMQAMLAVVKHIQDNYRTLTLGELAERFHYEPSYLGKQIKAATGKNYTDIIRELRVEEAKHLLRATELTVDQIAERVGYTGRVHFFRNFRGVVGMTPGEYRKLKRT